jgi:hypothetical protein
VPNIQFFTPDLSAGISPGAVSAAFALPNSADALLYITNLGSLAVAFKLGANSGVTVTKTTGMVLNPGQYVIVGSAGMTHIAMVSIGGMASQCAQINLTSGN